MDARCNVAWAGARTRSDRGATRAHPRCGGRAASSYGTPQLFLDAKLTAEQAAFFAEFASVDATQSLVPAPFDPLVKAIRQSKIAGISGALDTLLASGRLVRVGEHVYRDEQMAEIRTRLVRTLRAERRITAARLRDVVGTSRKYVVPLLEYFDAIGVTVRDGDERALRA